MTAGTPEKSGAFWPTEMTLLYLPANAGSATSETTTRLRRTFRIDAFSCRDSKRTWELPQWHPMLPINHDFMILHKRLTKSRLEPVLYGQPITKPMRDA